MDNYGNFETTAVAMEAASSPSVDKREVERFAQLAAEWWNPKGKFRPLHLFNPVRLAFIRSAAAEHFGRDARALRPFGALSLLDIGCGGGLLSEPMARMGFQVTGVDASEKNVRTAAAHAQEQNLAVQYRTGTAEALGFEGCGYDVVLNMEVVEHVANVPDFLHACAGLINPGGLMFVATLNRTLKSLMLAKFGAEYVLRWLPAGTHDWHRFLTPAELRARLEGSGLKVIRTQGIVFDPLRWDWRLSTDTDVNYVIVATRA